MKQLSHILLFILLILSCRDTDEMDQNEQCNRYSGANTACNDFDPAACMRGILPTLTFPAFSAPCFNPLNDQQFTCLEFHSGQTSLIIVDLSTNRKTVVLDNFPILGQPSWGKQGWITFSTLHWKVYKVYQDGTGLQQLTYSKRDLGPEFDPSGTKIMYGRYMDFTRDQVEQNPELVNLQKMMVIDLEGNDVDSLCRKVTDYCLPASFYTWIDHNSFISERGPNSDGSIYGLSVFDLEGNETILHNWFHEGKNTIEDIAYDIAMQKVYFTTWREGLQVTDLNGSEIRTIKRSCDTRNYKYISVSGDGQKLLSAKTEAEVIGPCEAEAVTYIVLMDADGCNEERIMIE